MLRALMVVILTCFAAWAAVADEMDDKCQALRVLNEQYRGKALSISEKAIKAQMVAWYRANCRQRHVKRIRDDGRYAQVNPEIKQWFNTLTNQKGGLCCSMADGFSVDDPQWDRNGDHYRVFLDGQWFDVPEQAVVSGGNRIGRAIVWPVKSEGVTFIRCFMPGAET